MIQSIVQYVARERFFLKRSLVSYGVVLFVFLFCLPTMALAEQFFVDSDSDCCKRSSIEADFVRSGRYSMIFVEKGFSFDPQDIDRLVDTFDKIIYPRTIELIGTPWTPGIDQDERVAILLTNLLTRPSDTVVGGYFNSQDELPKSQASTSNERELLYINANMLPLKKLAAYVAHEFQHLVRYNQKERRISKGEERWLDELRSEYMPRFLGLEDDFKGSNLEQRIGFFRKWPNDSLTGWLNNQYDYASVNLFGQYLGDHFSPSLYRAMMANDRVGIPSIEKALSDLQIPLSFREIFVQWRLANYLNNPEILGGKYGYKNPHITFMLQPDHLFSFADLKNGEDSQLIQTVVHPYSSEVIRVQTCSRPVDLFISPDSTSSQAVSLIAHLSKLTNGSYRENLDIADTSLAMTLNPEVQESFFLLTNVSNTLAPVTFTAHAKSISDPRPCIDSIQPVFESAVHGDRAILQGKDFEKDMRLFISGKETPFIYRDTSMILADIPPNPDNQARVRILNQSGLESNFAFPWKRKSVEEIFEGALVRRQNDGQIYVIKDHYRRQLSEAIFSFYGDLLRHDRIQTISPSKFDSYQESTLIRQTHSPNVYEVLSNGTKRWIKTENDFVTRGFHWDAVYTVNERELQFYPEV